MKMVYFARYLLRRIARSGREQLASACLASRYKNVYIAGTAKIQTSSIARIELESSVYIGDFTIINVEDDPLSGLTAVNQHSELFVGERSYIGPLNNIRAAGSLIHIGHDCLISQLVTIVGSNHGTAPGAPVRSQPWSSDRRGVTIEDDVWIGAGAVILPGVRIGRGAIVAAQSVITKDVLEYDIVAGIPAKKIRSRKIT